ncbi:ABC transporter ATP-binding protein, partial [uncultured Megasphaera sp.]
MRGVSLSLEEGEIVVLAGESGCGKSALCRSIVKLLPRYAVVKSGHIVIGGHDITQYTEKDMQAVRGLEVGMVFQNPLTTLNPVLSIGTQLAEALKRRTSAGARELNEQAVGLLEQVGIQQGKERLAMMPAEFSGGQRQRITLAIALASQPRLLIADEPTTALDVTVQLRMIDLLRNLAKNSGLTVLLVTHDLGVAARIADRVGIM